MLPYQRMALNLVNTALPVPVDAAGLRAAVRQGGPAGHVLMEEAPISLLAGLVGEGLLNWGDLQEAAARSPPASDETAEWIRDMARLALA